MCLLVWRNPKTQIRLTCSAGLSWALNYQYHGLSVHYIAAVFHNSCIHEMPVFGKWQLGSFVFSPGSNFSFRHGHNFHLIMPHYEKKKTVDTSIYNLMVFTFAHVLFNWGINNLQPFNLNCKSNAMNNILIMLCQHCKHVSVCVCACLCVCDFDCLNLVL